MNRERAAFMENALKVRIHAGFINGNVRSMLDAMKSHNHLEVSAPTLTPFAVPEGSRAPWRPGGLRIRHVINLSITR